MSSSVGFTGLASGLDTTSLVQNIQRFSQQRISLLNKTVTTDQAKQTAFKGIQSDLQSLQLAASQLGQPQGSVFDNTTVTSSNSNIVTAATGSGAQTGITNLQVLSLAQANQIASQGFADPNTVITQGTFQVQVGSQNATLSIDSSNDTLKGLASAINNAGLPVTATIVNTGSSDPRTQPYRLVLTSAATGTANAITITNNLAASGSGAVLPNFSTTEVGPAVTATNFSGTASVAANTGAGNYTGTSNDSYTFTVAHGGTVGTDNGITLNYTNSSGSETGTITVNAADVNTAKSVVDGVQVTFGAGTLNAGDQFSVNVTSPVLQAATNAQVQLGSGAGALVVQSSTNTISNLIPGVTLSLQAAAPGQAVQLNVQNDIAGATTAITNFVNDYNTFASAYATATQYTPGAGTTAGTAGPLNGIGSILGLRSQVEQQMLALPSNLPSQLNQLGVLGITPDSTGQLQINTSQLNSVLNGNVAGIGFSNLKSLFAIQGQSSSTGVQFATAGSKTVPSSTPYTVHITQAATQASITGTNTIGSSTVIDGTNNTLVMQINGQSSGTITLASGTYTPQALASQLQSAINAAISSTGNTVNVSQQNGNLIVTSATYGSNSSLSLTSGSALSSLGFNGSEQSTGVDVAGSFIVNGVTEPATGNGQILQGDSTNANTAGLILAVTYTPSQILAGGTDSTLTVTSGVASTLSNTLSAMLDPVNGQITTLSNQFATEIQNAQKDVTTQTAAMNTQQAALMSQFAALESVLANLQATSNLLTTELNSPTTTAGPSLSQLHGGNSSSTSSSTTSNGSSNTSTGSTTTG